MTKTNMQDLHKKSESELVETVQGARKTIQEEHFKDKFSRKAATIQNAKKDIARSLTELSLRRRNNETK
jgi:ribosomal protein L29